jgi:hypothetical protein
MSKFPKIHQPGMPDFKPTLFRSKKIPSGTGSNIQCFNHSGLVFAFDWKYLNGLEY